MKGIEDSKDLKADWKLAMHMISHGVPYLPCQLYDKMKLPKGLRSPIPMAFWVAAAYLVSWTGFIHSLKNSSTDILYSWYLWLLKIYTASEVSYNFIHCFCWAFKTCLWVWCHIENSWCDLSQNSWICGTSIVFFKLISDCDNSSVISLRPEILYSAWSYLLVKFFTEFFM